MPEVPNNEKDTLPSKTLKNIRTRLSLLFTGGISIDEKEVSQKFFLENNPNQETVEQEKKRRFPFFL